MLSDGHTGLSNTILRTGSSSTHDSEGDNNKKYWFNKQNDSSSLASNFLVHFCDIYGMTLENSIHGKIVYI